MPDVAVLKHSPADVLRQALVDLGLATDPPSATWPASVDVEPDRPDNCITVYDTAARPDTRSAIDGRQSEHYGIQVRVRAGTYAEGWEKASTLYNALARTLSQQVVNLDGTPYLIECASHLGGVLPLRRARREDRRVLFVINFLIVLYEI
jgi:hypothetical protein